MVKLTVIIPAYNEERVIEQTLTRVVSFLTSKKFSWEIIIVDDGSKDDTSKIVNSFKSPKVRLVRLAENKGKGAALKEGFLNAKGEYQIFSDADLSVPIENIDGFLKKLKVYDVVVGSRRVKGARIEVHQPWLRENMGRTFTFITGLLMGINIADFTCGFKGFKKKVAKDIFEHSLISRWAYDAEILFLAKKKKYKIFQYPISWRNRKDTRVKLGKVVFETLRDLIKIRLYDMEHRYDSKD